MPIFSEGTVYENLPLKIYKIPDSDRSIEIPESFKKIMEALKKLKNADRDKNSFNKDELKQALKVLGAYFPGWRAYRAFVKADANNDGQISGDEIQTLLQYVYSYGFGK